MPISSFRLLFLIAGLLLTACSKDKSPEGSIEGKKVLELYAEAFNRHDPQKMAELWSDQGVWFNTLSGEKIEGKAKVEEHLKHLFTVRKADHVEIEFGSFSTPEPGKLLVTGLFKISLKDNIEPIESAFEATMVHEERTYRIQSIRIVNMDAAASNGQHLEKLSWMIGDWEDRDDDSTVRTHADWDKHHNFIIQRFAVSVFGEEVLEGRQIIGWDPIHKRIRSWMFDSDGGYGEGKWYEKEGSYYVQSHSVMGDGKRASATFIYTPVDAKQYRFASEGRSIEGEILPNISPVDVFKVSGGR